LQIKVFVSASGIGYYGMRSGDNSAGSSGDGGAGDGGSSSARPAGDDFLAQVRGQFVSGQSVSGQFVSGQFVSGQFVSGQSVRGQSLQQTNANTKRPEEWVGVGGRGWA
jgi:hypothetical protein